MLFKKQTQIKKVVFTEEDESFGHKEVLKNISPSELFEYLKTLSLKSNKEIVIDYITEDNVVHLTNIKSLQYEDKEEKIEKITDLIKDYIAGNSIQMKAYSVTIDGQLEEVFTEHLKAKACKSRLMRKGINENTIKISEIYIK